jgi:hypothetical protein
VAAVASTVVRTTGVEKSMLVQSNIIQAMGATENATTASAMVSTVEEGERLVASGSAADGGRIVRLEFERSQHDWTRACLRL